MEDDLLLQTLGNFPISIYRIDEPDRCVCKVYNLTIRQITKLKYSRYVVLLKNLVAKTKDFGVKCNDSRTTFDIIIDNMKYGNDEYRIMILEAFELFLHENISYLSNSNEFYIGNVSDNRIIDINIFNQIIDVLKVQNCIRESNEENTFNPANKKAKDIITKMKQSDNKLKKLNKQNNSKEVSIFDLISILAANGNNNLNILNIWDLTLFQFEDQFFRMKMIEEYDVGIRSLLAGAAPEKVKLKNYIRKIDYNNSNNEIKGNKNSKSNNHIKINRVQRLE